MNLRLDGERFRWLFNSVQHIRKRIVCQTNDKSDARLLLPATSPGADLTAAEPISWQC